MNDILNLKKGLTIVFLMTSSFISAQSHIEYKFEFQAADNSEVSFSINMPEIWNIVTETKGTPFDVIGFETSNQNNIALNECSKDLRLGMSFFQGNIDDVLYALGFNQSPTNGLYLYEDIDGYINIIYPATLENSKESGIQFTLEKLNICEPGVEEEKNKKKLQKLRKRQNDKFMIKQSYLLFTNGTITICLESFNGEFDQTIKTLLESSIKIQNL